MSATKRPVSLLAAWDRRHHRSEGASIFAGFFAHRATCLKADGKDITDLKLILNADSCAEIEAGPVKNRTWSKRRQESDVE